jgi:hypothetical protein
MKAHDLIERAISQMGRGTSYGLGAGDLRPDDATAMDADGACDCSAFVCWCLRIPKMVRDLAWLKRVNGGWYNTDGIWWDASRENTGIFTLATGSLRPGTVLVYPAAKTLAAAGWSDSTSDAWGELKRDWKTTPKIGHVGIVVSGNAWDNARVIHCSAGNERKYGDAIQVTDAAVFRVRSTVAAWCELVER